MNEALLASWSKLWTPPMRPTLSVWAEQNFYTSPEYSSSTGLLRLHQYQREPLDCFTDPSVREIVVKCGTQMVKTLLLQVALAYVAVEDPGPCLLSQCKEDDAASFSKERLVPMIRDIPLLAAMPGLASKSRAAGSTATYKEFPGGSWSLVGAGAPSNAARRSIRYLMCDEIDKYETTKEGAFTELAAERTATFGTRAKEIYCCSPTTPDGPISRKYEASDQRRPWVPCPDCGEFQLLKWGQVKWDAEARREDRPFTARYECIACGIRWDDLKRWTACTRLEWRADRPFRGIAGFGDLGHLYSPYKSLEKMVRKWLSIAADKSPEAAEDLRVFVNTNLAEEYIEKGDAPEWKRIYDLRESYPLRTMPNGALFVTAGIDVQADRLEVYMYAWGRGKESWLVDFAILDGRPAESAVWEKLNEVLGHTYRHESGVDFPIIRYAIDSGHCTTEVYAWARQQGPGRCAVIKGESHGASIIGVPSAVDVVSTGKRARRGVQVWPVQVSLLKSEFYACLRLDRPTAESGECFPPGFCHFPEFAEEFFRQLTAEQLITRIVKGYRKQEWTKTRERNEALDTRIYARAAASMFGLDRFQAAQWAQLEVNIKDAKQTHVVAEPAAVLQDVPQLSVTLPPAGYRQRGGWLDRGSGRGWLSK